MSTHHLVTLGTLMVQGVTWNPPKALTLLTYLHLEGPNPRRRLRELFWPRSQDPGVNLRVVLGHLRRELPDAVTGADLLSAHVTSDAAALLGRQGGISTSGDPFYPGAFLAGVELSDVSPELDEWILETRERLAGAARLEGLRRAELSGSPGDAERWAAWAYALPDAVPPEREELERFARLALPGSRLEAQVRHDLNDVAPGTPVTAHAEQELLGRDGELSELLLALARREVRSIEITGPGGIGKSTLAAALLREQAALDGIRVLSVPLEHARAASQAAAQVAAALGVQVQDHGDGWTAFGEAWGEQSLLLLLDGAEGLPDLVDGVRALLGASPNVRVVVTSRVRRLDGAHHLALDGLAVPVAGDAPERVARSAAVQLFVRGARRHVPHFELDDRTAPVVSAIVRRLDGHPLATVLSATWMRVHAPEHIHTLILQDLAALHAETGSSERHQLRAVFERSWALLDTEERRALSALSSFHGFDTDAAMKVTGVTPDLLQRLQRHSLIHALPTHGNGPGRLEVPPVLAAQALRHLHDPAPVQTAHAAYYLALLERHAPDAEQVQRERANLLGALSFALAAGQPVSAHVDAFLASYDRTGQLAAGLDAFLVLQEALAGAQPMAAGSVLIGRAWLAHLTGNFEDSASLTRTVLDGPEHVGSVAAMKAHNILSLTRRRQGQLDAASESLAQALALAGVLHDDTRRVMYSLNLSDLLIQLGRYDECTALLDTLDASLPPEADGRLRAQITGQRLRADHFSGTLSPAEVSVRCRALLPPDRNRTPTYEEMLLHLQEVRALLQLGQLTDAAARLRDLLPDLHASGVTSMSLAGRLLNVQLLYRQGRSAQANAEAVTALRQWQGVPEDSAFFELLLAVAAPLLRADAALALRALGTLLRHPAGYHDQRVRARDLLSSAGVPDPSPPFPDVQALAADLQAHLETLTASRR